MKRLSTTYKLWIVHLEDKPQDRELVADFLAAEGIECKITYAKTGSEFRAALARETSDLILCDYTMPSYSGMEALRAARQAQPETPFIFVSGTIGEERAVESLRLGATDYVLKERLDRLVPVMRRALSEAELRRMSRQAEAYCVTLTDLGFRLSAARSAREAAEVIGEVAERALGWDAFAIHLCSEEAQTMEALLMMRRIEGQRAEVSQRQSSPESNLFLRTVLRDGSPVLLRFGEGENSGAGVLFGDAKGRAAMLISAPICHGSRAAGVLSLQSYSKEAYDKEALQILQVLADHCGATLERIVTHEQLQATQQRLEQLLAQSPAVLYSLRLNEKEPALAWISSNIEHLLGFSAAEACAAGWWRRQIHPQDHLAPADTQRQLLAGNQSSRDVRIRHRNGEYRWVRDAQRLICDDRGKPVEIAGSWVDITEHKRAEHLTQRAQKMEPMEEFHQNSSLTGYL
jgi:PAS domain S-box-containing protein